MCIRDRFTSLQNEIENKDLKINLFVPPVQQDTGVSLGAALYVERNEHERTKRMEHAYYGYNPAEEEISRVVHKSGLGFKFLEDKKLIEKISQCLVDQKIVGWYNGRAEIGARALGARSLLMDPRNVENWHRMNEVKGREIWRPLAPSILKEHVADFFDVVDSPLADFMVGAFQVKEEAQSIIPACVHVDGSARPQFVNKETNPLYHALISSFYEKTGVPVVMNTSFNLADEPIVHTPQDAILSFIRSDIDVLVLGNYFIEKKAGK